MKFFVMTLGCKVNQYETQAVTNILVSRGHELTQADNGCDVCIINTCTVTAESARKSRQAIRRIKKTAPDAIVAVCGCLSQLEPETAVMLGADLVGGSADRYKFAIEVEKLFAERVADAAQGRSDATGVFADKKEAGESEEAGETAQSSYDRGAERQTKTVTGISDERYVIEHLPPGAENRSDSGSQPSSLKRTRALLKIQDGCDNYCAYCVIPYARGHARSLPVETAAEYARRIGAQGFREIVVTGIEISSYGKDLEGKPALTDVLRAISGAAPDARIRIGSLDPRVVTEKFCQELSDIANLCDHFHLSLQSGCDETLRRMGRKYDTDAVKEGISSLLRRFPGSGITADLITGFPGETDGEFKHTMEFIKTVSFSDMHIFPFSRRPGTFAAIMPGQIEKSIVRERASIAAAVAMKMAYGFRKSMVGKTVEVLFERERGGYWTGHSGNYIEVSVKNGGERNSVRPVRITNVENGYVWGEL